MTTCSSCGSTVPGVESRCPVCGAASPPPVAKALPSLEPATAPARTGASPAVGVAGLSAASVAAVPAAAVSYASLGDRMLAVLVDALVLVAIFWALGMWAAPKLGGVTADGFNLEGTPALIVITVSVVLFLAYCVCFEWWLGATPGKIVAGVTITGADGRRIDLRQSLLRNLFRVIDGIGVYLVAALFVLLTRRRQRLGDLAARTVVTRHECPGAARVAVLLALVALPVVAIAGTWSLRTAPGARATSVESATSTGIPSTSAGGPTSGAGGPPVAPAASLGDIVDGPLVVSGLRFAAGEDGPERPNAAFKAGETPTLRFEVKGFAFDQATQKGRVHLRVSGRDPDGVAINEPRETEVQPPAAVPVLKSWANVSLPDYAIPGDYRLDVTVTDLAGNRRAVVSAPFKVEGPRFEPSAVLTLRNVRLTEGEDGPPRSDAIYRPGSTVWMAFEAVGFKTDAGGTLRLQEHVAVTSASGVKGPEGQVLDLNRSFSYAPRHMPITNHISLGDMPPGEYQATITMTDGVGNQRCEQVVRFTIQK